MGLARDVSEGQGCGFSALGLRTAPLLEGVWRPGFQRVSRTHTPTTQIITLRMGGRGPLLQVPGTFFKFP